MPDPWTTPSRASRGVIWTWGEGMLCPYVGMKTAKGLMVCFLGSWKNVKVVMPWHPRGNVQTVQILHPRDESPLGTQEGQETHGIKES